MTAVAGNRLPSRGGSQRRHLGVVGEEGVRALSGVTGTVVGVGIVFVVAALFGLAVSHTMLVQGEDRLVEMNRRLETASERYRELSAEVAGLESPARVEAEAEGRLGMVRPERVSWLVEVDPHTELSARDLDGLLPEQGASQP